MSHTGTAKGIAAWLKHVRPPADDSSEEAIALIALPLEGPAVVASWTRSDWTTDAAAWSEQVITLADHDAQARGQTMKYEVRHAIAGSTMATTHLRRVVAVQRDEHAPPEGSLAGLLSQAQKAAERASQQVIEMARVNQAAMMAQAQVIVGQAELIRALQAHSAEQSARIAELQDAAPQPAGPSSKDQMFGEMMKIAGPIVAQKFLEAMNDTPRS